MNNWKEELQKLLRTFAKEMIANNIASSLTTVDEITDLVNQVEQDAYKRGLEDKEKIAECNPVKLTYEEMIDMERVKQEGIKEGLERARKAKPKKDEYCYNDSEECDEIESICESTNDSMGEAQAAGYNSALSDWDDNIQQELNKL